MVKEIANIKYRVVQCRHSGFLTGTKIRDILMKEMHSKAGTKCTIQPVPMQITVII
jgi:hypothetical protein